MTSPSGTSAKSAALAGSKQFFCASVSPFTSSSGGFGASRGAMRPSER